jgi:multidrug efflux pump
MRIWLDPAKLTGYNLTPLDVKAAVAEQNIQVAVGELRHAVAVWHGAQRHGEHRKPADHARAVRQHPAARESGRLVGAHQGRRPRGTGRRRLLDARPHQRQAGLGHRHQAGPTGNALATATAVRAKMEELSRFFPPDYEFSVPYDTSAFVKISIEEVVKTLLEAVVLVFLVMYLFLQNFRATLIPTLVVPVALLGTFGAMLAFGFSINVLTMFGMVLAIGILVDDAIVVVENVERIMSEDSRHVKPRARRWARSRAPSSALRWC